MSFFERFRGTPRLTPEAINADPGLGAAQAELKAAKESYAATLADSKNMDLIREKAGLEVELELENLKPQKSPEQGRQILQRMQEIDTEMEEDRNSAREKERLS
ncbi:MAG: hypothetical protein AAB850_01720 [Patescibacteria group bacterium]